MIRACGGTELHPTGLQGRSSQMQRWLRLALPVALSGCASSATSAESATDAGSGP
jgi:hypothetical protein